MVLEGYIFTVCAAGNASLLALKISWCAAAVLSFCMYFWYWFTNIQYLLVKEWCKVRMATCCCKSNQDMSIVVYAMF
jgi:hypothetical protein